MENMEEEASGRKAQLAAGQVSMEQEFKMNDSSSPADKIRNFAKMNPQIIAAMIRLWLKEEEQEE